jgi:hypothetical protein
VTPGQRERAVENVIANLNDMLVQPDWAGMSPRQMDRFLIAQATFIQRQTMATERLTVLLADINRQLGDLVRAVEDIR